MDGPSRNDPMGIVWRTRKNLDHIKREFDDKGKSSEVHVIVHVVNSLLGLVVLPAEKKLVEKGKGPPLKDLGKKGWPKWDIPDDTKTLGDLIYHLRNAAAHGHYTFSSNSRHLHEVTITVKDSKDGGETFYWSAKIRGDKLYRFCMKFAAYLTSTSSSTP